MARHKRIAWWGSKQDEPRLLVIAHPVPAATGGGRVAIPTDLRGLAARNWRLTAVGRLGDTLGGAVEFPIPTGRHIDRRLPRHR